MNVTLWPVSCKIFRNKCQFVAVLKLSFCGCKYVILQIQVCHFVGLSKSLSRSKDLDFVDLKSSFCWTKGDIFLYFADLNM